VTAQQTLLDVTGSETLDAFANDEAANTQMQITVR
jgi:hypothetical protein